MASITLQDFQGENVSSLISEQKGSEIKLKTRERCRQRDDIKKMWLGLGTELNGKSLAQSNVTTRGKD